MYVRTWGTGVSRIELQISYQHEEKRQWQCEGPEKLCQEVSQRDCSYVQLLHRKDWCPAQSHRTLIPTPFDPEAAYQTWFSEGLLLYHSNVMKYYPKQMPCLQERIFPVLSISQEYCLSSPDYDLYQNWEYDIFTFESPQITSTLTEQILSK